VPAPIKLAMIETLSGPFANTGEAVYRNLLWAVERVNARGGIRLNDGSGARLLSLQRYDNKGQSAEALSALKSAIDDGAGFVLQGNSSATALALLDAINKHNDREPAHRVLFLNYSAVDPVLTNEKCSFWHFRFDAHADMRLAALMTVLREDRALRSVYILGQDYSFGQAVAREARRQLTLLRPDVQIVGDELHPMGRVKDFSPYVAKIKASGAQAIITGNFGNDLTLLVKSARELGFEGQFYTFYGNALGAPAAIGYQAFRQRFPQPADDYVHLRMQLMVEALVQAIEQAGSLQPVAVARQLARARVTLAGQSGAMRAADHQFQQPLVVGVMERQGAAGVKFDVEGSGFGFRVIKTLSAAQAEQPSRCVMQRPD
jgi:branched-chain amino acid transport system substrate-binding protein